MLERFDLPKDKALKKFSKGMKMKFAITAAMAHRPKLLVLDEATSGLDPVVRDDILDMLLDFVQEEDHSVLVSSHITSDLEKIADYIVFLHEGRIAFTMPRDELVENYGILQCGAAQFAPWTKTTSSASAAWIMNGRCSSPIAPPLSANIRKP